MNRFKNILFFADAVDNESTTLDRAVALAQSNDAHLTVIDVNEPADLAQGVEQNYGIDLDEVLMERRLEELETLTAPYTDSGVLIYTQVRIGKPFIEVIRAVQRNGYDLLIKTASSPQGFAGRLFGSTDMHLLRKCPCPVWINRPDSAHRYRTMLAAVDPFEETDAGLARLILDLSTSLASREKAELHIVHAWRLEGESMLASGRGHIPPAELKILLDAQESRHRKKFTEVLNHYSIAVDEPNVHLVKGLPAEVIIPLADKIDADLIIMGTVGRSGIPGLIMGNTAENILQGTEASVLAVKPNGFVSPVKSDD